MHDRGDFSYYNLRARLKSDHIGLLFPGWEAGNERVAVICPHDDDGLLGAGYAILAALTNEAEIYPFILCNGCAGYSTPEEKENIVERRKDETVRAYQALGISANNIIRFDYPDFSLLPNIGWLMPWGKEGTFPHSLQIMRELRISRLLVPNGYREHIDHEAAYRIAAYDGPQVGDNILADWGGAPPIKTFLQYAVWGDFSPEDAVVTNSDLTLRGNRAILARLGVEETVQKGIREFRSQERVVEGLIEARKGKRRGERVIEVYLAFDPRPALDYAPYHETIAAIR